MRYALKKGLYKDSFTRFMRWSYSKKHCCDGDLRTECASRIFSLQLRCTTNNSETCALDFVSDLSFFFTVTIVSVLLYPPSVAISLALCSCIFSSSSPDSSTFSSSIPFAQCFFSLSFQTVESLHKLKFTSSVANNFCFLK